MHSQRLLTLTKKGDENKKILRDRLLGHRKQGTSLSRKRPGKKYLKPIVKPAVPDRPPDPTNQVVEKKEGETDSMYEYALDLIKNGKEADTYHVRQLIGSHLNSEEHNFKELGSDGFNYVFLTYDTTPKCRFQNCYWLTIASEDIVHEQDYFTLSHAGVTRIADSDIEFTDLGTWLFEKSVFDRIVNMSCVERIRLAAQFYRWKDYVYGTRFRAARYIECNGVE